MSNEQMENALKVMYEEIKSLKIKVKELDEALQVIYSVDIDAGNKKRDYWNVDNHANR